MSEESLINRLEQLAALPLERIVVSACCSAQSDALGIVGGADKKFAAAQALEDHRLLAFGVTHGQPGVPEGGLVVSAKTLEEMAGKLCSVLPKVYGPIEDLPVGLDGATDTAYAAQRFRPFPWLVQQVSDALKTTARSSGYLFIVGGPARGKTSWALDWVRASLNPGSPLSVDTRHHARPALSGWFFARRSGVGNTPNSPYLREETALQTLISMARLRRGVAPKTSPVALLEGLDHRYNYRNSSDQAQLGEDFQKALHELATAEPRPTQEHPLVLLLDGADELWGAGENTFQQRYVFPQIFPLALPDHVYIVLLSRPGSHLLGQEKIQPILRYEFTPGDIRQASDDYFEFLADQVRFHDESQALRNPALKKLIYEASQGAFGYVTWLLDSWWALPSRREGSSETSTRLEQIQRWLDDPASLPRGEYEQRARELVKVGDLLRSDPHDLKASAAQRLFVQALATLTLLPEARLTLKGLAELVVERNSDVMDLEDHLRRLARQFLVKPGHSVQADPTDSKNADGWPPAVYLTFDHLLTAEVALAHWELLACRRLSHEEDADPIWRQVARHAQAVAQRREALIPTENTASNGVVEILTEEERQAAQAQLHRRLGERSALHWPRLRLRPAKKEAIDRWENHQRYAVLWGPWHAFKSEVGRNPGDEPQPSSAIAPALELLLDAGYLQTVVRAGGPGSEPALRATYIAADQASGAAANQSLRHRIESAVLGWHEHLVNDSLQVGALLWNLLGAWEPARDRAAYWKASLDQMALVTALPGVPMDFVRQLHGYNQQALSPCGQWLVTTGPAGTAVWDLRQGAHRLHSVTRLQGWEMETLCCAAVDNTLYLLGSHGQLLWVGLVDLRSDAAIMACYAGHTRGVLSVALHADGEGLIGLSGSEDHTVGVLVLSRAEIQAHAIEQATTPEPQPGRLARFAGHTSVVWSVALHTDRESLIGLSGSSDDTVGVLALTRAEIQAHATAQDTTPEPQPGRLARYAGHTRGVDSVALRADGEGLIGLSGSGDNTVGVLVLTRAEIQAHATAQAIPPEPQPGRLARYAGHTQWVNSVALHADREGLIGMSGSSDDTVGVLALTRAEIQAHATAQALQPGRLARYAGHIRGVHSVALHAEGEGLIGLSGSDDDTVGVLALSRADIQAHSTAQALTEQPQPGRLARYAGHANGVNSVALHADHQGLIGLSSSEDYTVGVLVLRRDEIKAHAAQQATTRKPQPGRLARYAGHTGGVRSVALHADREGLIGLSGSADRTVGVLAFTRAEIEAHATQQAITQKPQPGWLAQYAGHENGVNSVALHADHQGLIGLSSSNDETVGVLVLRRAEITAHAAAQAIPPEPQPGRLARYAGHTRSVDSVALHAGGECLIGLSGSADCTVGVLALTRAEIEAHATQQAITQKPQPGWLARYAGHTHWVMSVALHADREGLIGLSGSWDGPVGVLALTRAEIEAHAIEQATTQKTQPGRLARYAGHTHWVMSVALHADREGLIGLSGSDDETVGVLDLRRADVVAHAQQQAQSQQPDGDRLQKFFSTFPFKWRSHRGVTPANQEAAVFWGLSTHAILQATVTPAAAEHPTQWRVKPICPFHEPGFTPHDLVHLDEHTLVVGGACGKDVALLLLEWVRPT